MWSHLIAVTGSTERFTAIIALLGAILGLLGGAAKAALHVLRTIDALLAELHANTKATKEVADKLQHIEQRVDGAARS